MQLRLIIQSKETGVRDWGVGGEESRAKKQPQKIYGRSSVPSRASRAPWLQTISEPSRGSQTQQTPMQTTKSFMRAPGVRPAFWNCSALYSPQRLCISPSSTQAADLGSPQHGPWSSETGRRAEGYTILRAPAHSFFFLQKWALKPGPLKPPLTLQAFVQF